MTTWVLRAADLSSHLRWRWLLSDADGHLVADHEVDLDPASAEHEAFDDLDGYLRRNAAPDDRVATEAEIVDWLGEWLGVAVLGQAIGHAILDSDLDTVLVDLPARAAFLLDRPLELAHVDGESLTRRGIRLVYRWPGERQVRKEPVGAELRILALFSMPSRTSVLALRRERHELAHLVRLLAKQTGKAVHIRVVQYGVTRERLRGFAEESPGWDVLHVAGHGEHGLVLLEHADGTADPVHTADLVELLRPARRRLKLAVLGTCHSGAATAAETLQRLGLAEQAERFSRRSGDGVATVGPAVGLVEAFGVAAVGMRYPVSDEFAITLTGELYRRLLGGLPVDRALGLAVPVAAGRVCADRPALSVGTPALFGSGGIGLRLNPPDREPELDPYRQRMPGFPDEPTRFVGRTQLLIDASTALAPRSDRTGVLLLGMAGAGKSTAAVELAYQHENGFGGLAWWRAPERETAPGEALGLLADALEAQLPRFRMTEALGSAATFQQFLPRLAALLRDEVVLLVLDNLETLLSRNGSWRDPQWTDLVDVLTGHRGASRVVLTSRVTPAGLGTERVAVLPVHALSLAESALLARELPNLKALLDGDSGQRTLVREVINVVQGHPGLLELADAAATDPGRLRDRLDMAHAAATVRGEPLDSFFATGSSDLDPGQFLRALTSWTTGTLADLPEPARRLAELLACLEEDDRQSGIVAALWPRLWEPGEAVPLAEPLALLRDAALVHPDPDRRIIRYTLHPGVAEAIRSEVPAAQQSTLDDLIGALWWAICQDRMERENQGTSTTEVVHAALAAVPYLVRLARWGEVAKILHHVLGRDRSPGTAVRLLGHLDLCLAQELDPADRLLCETVHAITLAAIDPAGAETRLRAVLVQADAQGRSEMAAVVAGKLADLARDHGRLTDAVELAQSRLPAAPAGSWTEASHEATLLQNLALLGRSEEALDRATTLLTHLDTLEPEPDGAPPWQVLELVLDAACRAARGQEDWAGALEFNRRIQHSEGQRGAGRHEQASTRFNEATLLARLGRRKEAERLLRHCQQVFQDFGDLTQLGRVFSARAQLERTRRRPERAIDLEQLALRYVYQRAEVHSIAVCHHNLAGHLSAANRKPATAIAHLLAATLLWHTTGHESARDALENLCRLVPRPAGAVLPQDFDELVARVAVVPGVRFGQVFAGLLPVAADREALLREIADFAERYLLLGNGIRPEESG
ncbi:MULTISPECIES: CHAT domain-containing protein [unclassified Crossiella]|uniref:CHAT domain-containing protein n=1 Tax=unclassified Crossiella TaxID=2620835 RepID=UPI0027E54A4E|nr:MULTISPECIES: CHAT domain-containing protein [unclassified Crossiella]